MGLDKAIEHGKEHRKQYYGAKSYAYECRNHGGCLICRESRLHKYNKLDQWVKEGLREYDDLPGINVGKIQIEKEI